MRVMAKRSRPNNLLPMKKNGVKSITVEESVQLFIKEMQIENLRERTIQFHQENLHVFFKFFKAQGIEVNFETLNKQLIKDHFILYMLQRKYKTNTVNGRIKTLRKYLSFLYIENYIQVNIALELKKVRGPRIEIDAFSKEQIVALLNQPNRESFTG